MFIGFRSSMGIVQQTTGSITPVITYYLLCEDSSPLTTEANENILWTN